MLMAERRIDDEISRIHRICDSSTHKQAMAECEMQIIAPYKDRFYTESYDMIRDEKVDDLGRMYRLLSKIANGLDPLQHIFQQIIIQLATRDIALLQGEMSKDIKLFVDTILHIHTKYTFIIDQCLAADSNFYAAMDRAMRKIVNESRRDKGLSESSEILARYCDYLMKKGNKLILNDIELDERLDGVMTIFKYIDDKDAFQKFYMRLLAKRLIYDTSISSDMESNFMSRLKVACGYVTWKEKKLHSEAK